jgi:Zn-dependent protease
MASMDSRHHRLSSASTEPPVGALEPPTPPGFPASAPSPLDAEPHPADAFGQSRRPLHRRIGGALAVIVAVIVKFGIKLKALLLLLPKLKLLTTSGTMLVSIAAYSLIWGWQFAVGFVGLLLVHEMGHVIALRREGIKASAPMFIPFLGAVISAKSLGGNALAEARVGLAGPILGSLGAAAMIPLAEATGNNLFYALAFTGFFLNLFNLLPVLPLDGGRAMAAMAPAMWLVGLAVLVALTITFPNPIMLLILLFGGMETWRRWRGRRSGDPEATTYYRVSPRNRLLVAAVYVGLIVALAVGMSQTHIVRHV